MGHCVSLSFYRMRDKDHEIQRNLNKRIDLRSFGDVEAESIDGMCK